MQKFNTENLMDYMDIYAKGQFKKGKKLARIYSLKLLKKKKQFMQHDWSIDSKNLKDLFYVGTALNLGAPNTLPFPTLSLLGKMYFHKEQKDILKNILKDNAFSYNGEVLKLNDPLNQSKLQKAIKTNSIHFVRNFAA